MKKRLLIGVSALLSASLLLAAAGCDNGSGWYDKDIWMTEGESVPTESVVLPTSGLSAGTVSVHDPSVFYDDYSGTYYAFGTHFAVASSSDLITWTQEATDGNYSVLYGSESVTYNGVKWPAALESSLEEIEPSSSVTTTWAPDVMKIDGTYYMYYCITSAFGFAKSLIGRVSSDSVMGPYSNNEIIIRSYSTNTSSSSTEPNCIDPELFYDADGGLWMVYGSFAGGIYILELNATGENAGLPVEMDLSDPDYGTCIWKVGYSQGVEGPFVFYNAETEYYYLMVSEGDLESNYNMRVARSKTPNGPYEDITGSDVSTTAGKGNKLAGNFSWDGDSTNNVALGHNSVIKVDGKYLVVCHVRNAVSGGHHVEVRQLYFNEDGWPVLSPNRYVGEEKGLVTMSEAAGKYDVIVHSTSTTADIVSSAEYTFNSDGTITNSSSASAGSWSVTSDYYVTITLNSVEYKGVIAPGWRNYGTKAGILSFTATSSDGNALWANAAE